MMKRKDEEGACISYSGCLLRDMVTDTDTDDGVFGVLCSDIDGVVWD